MSINDIRRMENLPPVPGGDVYLQPLNMTNAGAPTDGMNVPSRQAQATGGRTSTMPDAQVADIERILL
jgi:hypothetical protein